MCNIGAGKCRVAVENQDFYHSSPSPHWKGKHVREESLTIKCESLREVSRLFPIVILAVLLAAVWGAVPKTDCPLEYYFKVSFCNDQEGV